MAADSNIEWTDATWNPVRGCSRISPGCENCYAERIASRFSMPGAAFRGFARAGRWTRKVALISDMLEAPLHWKKPRRIFVNSMSDLFHEDLPEEAIWKVFAVMANAPRHTFQILTKRARRMAELLKDRTGPFYMNVRGTAFRMRLDDCFTWPLPNVWLGVSVEDQARADERIPQLLQAPAAVRFLSCEPLLGPVSLQGGDGNLFRYYLAHPSPSAVRIDWVIVGGESGPGAREMRLDWAQRIVNDCKAAEVPVFCKQLGAKPVEFTAPWKLKDKKGGDPAEWPEALRVRDFPEPKELTK